MAPTPSSRSTKDHLMTTPLKTPQSKHRLHFSGLKTPNPSGVRENSNIPTEHPVEVVGRIRDHPDKKDRPASALDVAEDGRSVRVRTDIGYRDFILDGVSVAEEEDLSGFYKKFIQSRILDVKLGAKCTIMMYGPTGSGKSHTMFGCAKQPGIVYRALKDILNLGEEEKENSDVVVDDGGFGVGFFVQVAVLEIYNEEIYDLLSGCGGGGGPSVGLPKGNTPKVRLEVMGKKAKNASYISGNEPGKISREVAKVEKRRIVRSTLCNERSSRSHCMIILDVPSVGGRLMLVDMAGSENIEQAGQIGFEAKMQTAKINQGNTALKRVVESIANGDSHVPFRDSKLTMLLQDSFEDDKSKILMILCASPDPKEIHKTISTLEYGAKAKCIVRVAHLATPKDKLADESSAVVLGSRIAAMNQFIYKLQVENKQKVKERDEAKKELTQKENEVADLKSRLKSLEGRKFVAKEEEISSMVDERTLFLRLELKKMEDKMLQKEREIEALRQQLQDVESRNNKCEREEPLSDLVGHTFMKHLSETTSVEDHGMLKSMELDMGDLSDIHEVKEVVNYRDDSNTWNSHLNTTEELPFEYSGGIVVPRFPGKLCLSTVFEESEEGEEEEREGNKEEEEEEEEEEEIEKEVVEEQTSQNAHILDLIGRELERGDDEHSHEHEKEFSATRSTRIQNIFRLCGNYREIARHGKGSTPSKTGSEIATIQTSPVPVPVSLDYLIAEATPCAKELIVVDALQPELKHQNEFQFDVEVAESPVASLVQHPFYALDSSDDKKSLGSAKKIASSNKENSCPADGTVAGGPADVYVKWESSKELSGNLIKKMKVLENTTLSDLRILIEPYLIDENNQQPFTFLMLGDPTGAPVAKDSESMVSVSKLPICNKQLGGHLACLRPAKKNTQNTIDQTSLPLGPLENKLQAAAAATGAFSSPKLVVSNDMNYLTGGLRA